MSFNPRAVLGSISVLTLVPALLANRYDGRHKAVNALRKRQNGTVPLNTAVFAIGTAPLNTTPINTPATNTSKSHLAPTTTSYKALTTILPSSGAEPVEITAQSQVVQSFIPEMTLCKGPPIALYPTATLTGAPYLNVTLYSTLVAGTGTCETVYVPTSTTVCATTLTGIATKVTVSECDQEITFSSDWGFTLESPTPTLNNFTQLITPAPTVKTLMTYWLAPWQSLTQGETPSDVDIKVCTIIKDGSSQECLRYQEVWQAVVVTSTLTSTRDVHIATTVSGPGTLYVETLQAQITDTVVFLNLSTKLLVETLVETETVIKNSKLPVKIPGQDDEELPTSTTYITKEVKYNTQESYNSTVYVVETATLSVGTVTRTRVGVPLPRRTFLDIGPEFFE